MPVYPFPVTEGNECYNTPAVVHKIRRICGYHVLSPRSYRLIITIIVQCRPVCIFGWGTLRLPFGADPREGGNATQTRLGVTPHKM